ncbi:MAG: AMP-binding protein, partial [Acidimicrobiales bacterium]
MTSAPSFAARFAQLARERADDPALTLVGDRSLGFAELDRAATRLARHLASLGVVADDLVTIAEPNSAEFVIAAVACWKLGATPQPVSSRLPPAELAAVVELADPTVVIGASIEDRTCLPLGHRPPDGVDDRPLPDATAAAWKAPTSGGSTGRPKLIVSGDPSVYSPPLAALAVLIGARDDTTTVMPGPLYHNGPFIWTFLSLLAGSHVVL